MKHVPLILAALAATFLIVCLVEYRVHAFDGQAYSTWPPVIGFLLMFPGAELGTLINMVLPNPTDQHLWLNLMVFYIFPLLIVTAMSLTVFFVSRALVNVFWPNQSLQRPAFGRR